MCGRSSMIWTISYWSVQLHHESVYSTLGVDLVTVACGEDTWWWHRWTVGVQERSSIWQPNWWRRAFGSFATKI